VIHTNPRRMATLLGFILVMILAPVPLAHAGNIREQATDSVPTQSCNTACGNRWLFKAPSAAGALYITPRTSNTYSPGDWSGVNVAAPDWQYTAATTHFVRISFVGSNFGAHWEALVCAPACTLAHRAADAINVNLGQPNKPVAILLKLEDGPNNQTPSSAVQLYAVMQYYTVDNVPPTLGLSVNGSPFGGTQYFNASAAGDNGALEIDADAEDNTAVAGVSATDNGAGVPVSGDGSIMVGNGVNHITVGATDIAGNGTSASGTAVFDSVLPQVVLVNSSMVSTTSTPQVLFKASDPPANGYASGVGNASLMLGDSAVDSVFNKTGTFTVQPKVPLNDGSYPVNVQVSDGVGNIGMDANGGQLVVDTTAPSIPLTSVSPTPGSKYKTGGAPSTLNATAADNVGLQSVTMTFDGANVDVGAPPDTSDLSALTTAYPISADVPGVQCVGIHTWSVTATDVAGHPSTMTASYSVGKPGEMPKGKCKKIACSHAKTAVKRLGKAIQAGLRQLRKLNTRLKRAQRTIRHNRHKKNAEWLVAKQQASTLKTQIAGVRHTRYNDKVELHKARHRHGEFCH
jgi:hypothetical protein